MSESQSYVSDSDVTLPSVPRLTISSLSDVTDDETFPTTTRTTGRVPAGSSTVRDSGAEDEENPSARREEWAHMVKARKNKSLGNISGAVASDGARRRKSRIVKRSDSVDSVVNLSTSRSILKRDSAPDITTIDPALRTGSQTERPRRISTNRKVSFKGNHSEPQSPVEMTRSRRRKTLSWGSSPRDLLRSDAQGPGDGGGGVGPSPEKVKGPMRRRESMMNMLRTELMKTNKIKLPDRLAAGIAEKDTNNLDIRKEKSWDENFAKRKEEKPPLVKRQSMPALTRKDSARSSVSDDEVFMSNFDRRKLTLLSSLEKMGVKLPKRTIKRNDSNVSTDEAVILKRAAKGQRHGSLTSRTVLSKFDVEPVRKPANQSPEQKLDDATRSKLQMIFDTITRDDSAIKSALPGLQGRKQNSLTERDIAGSTANVFMARLRRRRKGAHTPSPRIAQLTPEPSSSFPRTRHRPRALIHQSQATFSPQANKDAFSSHSRHDIKDDTGSRIKNSPNHPNYLNSASLLEISDTQDGGQKVPESSSEHGHHLHTILEKVGDVSSVESSKIKADGPSLSTHETLLGQDSSSSSSSSSSILNAVPLNQTSPAQQKQHDLNEARILNMHYSTQPPQQSSLQASTTHRPPQQRTMDKSTTLSGPLQARNQKQKRSALTKLRTLLHPGRGGGGVMGVSRGGGRGVRVGQGERRSGELGGRDAGISAGSSSSSKGWAKLSSYRGVILAGARLAKRRRLMKKRNSNRFRNLAKFICLLLRAWRVHSIAVSAILEYHHTVEVTLDDQGKDNLLFDITEYKADTEARLSKEAIRILRKRPAERTPEEIHYVQIALWNYKSLAEYPVHMQKMIAERAWIESYGAKRVIVREGHLPMCFYFVLSGSALVSVMDVDKGVAKTVMYYNRGDSFGELAIMNATRRQSTVISKDNMQLLVLTDTDFVEVFMSGGLSNPDDPFLNSLPYLDGWPKEKLAENPKKANYSYFKRGTVLVADSHNNDWIIIVKSGSISLLKKLKAVDARKLMAERANKDLADKIQELLEQEQKGEVTHEDRVEALYDERQDQIERMGHLARFYALPQINVQTNEDFNEMKRQHDEFTELHGVSTLQARELAATAMSEHLQDSSSLSRGASNASLDRQPTGASLNHRKLSALVKKGPYMAKSKQSEGASAEENDGLDSRKHTTLSAIFRDNSTTQTEGSDLKKAVKPPPAAMFVNVQTLTKGMVFGLSDLFCENQPSMTLVSNGAECISISKKLFMEHASHAFVTRIREDIYPYPSEEDLQENLESQVVWDFHRRQVVTHVMQDIRWTRADKADARLDMSPTLGY